MDDDELDGPDDKQKLKTCLEALDRGNATSQDVESGIASAVNLARKTAIDLEINMQMHKNRFGSNKNKMPKIDPVKAYTLQCGNMAVEVQLLLEHPQLQFQHYQLKNEVGIDHHILAVTHENNSWVVDPSAEQFMAELTLPEFKRADIKNKFLQNGFFNKEDTVVAESFLSMYSDLGKKRQLEGVDELLSKSQTETPYIGNIEDAFVNEPRKIRREFAS